ncbi:hypothetical protein [Lapillicoccus sp.]|uniref:hypothetical protein n=1 Tax=Lapillicoccus sp. TaxID=1909287 RepID=UPI003982E972
MSQAHPPLSAQATRRLTRDTEPYLSCDDCFDQVDGYVEALLADPDHDLPAMRTHLAGCTACAEEARSLIMLVAEQDGLDPASAGRRLGAE